MRIIVTKDENEMSDVTVEYLLATMIKHRRVNIAITAGKTPVKMYEKLIPKVKNKDRFKHVHYYNFDEIPYEGSDEGVTISALRKLYFTPANISEAQIHRLTADNYESFDQIIKEDGGLDLMVLGLGYDGHFCGNVPQATQWKNETVRTIIPEEHRQSFADLELGGNVAIVPPYTVTMGPKSVMAVRALVLIVSGKHKAAILKEMLEGDIREDLPASILTLHPNLTIIADEEALTYLSDDSLKKYA